MRRAALLLLAGAAVLAAGAGSAQATNECRGLQVCVRVVGPWIAVAGARTDFQLSCPRGFIVGGLDARLSDRAIDVDFLGRVGSPVGPGVTTSRSALFRGTYAGSSPRWPSFRPYLGCVPASGGGPGPVPLRRPDAVFPPTEATVRRVRDVRLRVGSTRAVAGCARGERFVSGWHALAFFTANPPTPAMIQSVSMRRAVRGGRLYVTAQAGTSLRGMRAIVQAGALCGGTQ